LINNPSEVPVMTHFYRNSPR